MARAAKAATIDIRIAPFCSVVIDGRARGAGEVVAVSAKDAKGLIASGYAVPPDAPVAEPADASERREAFDDVGREVKHDRRGRRLLTPKVMDDGDEDRGA